LDLNDALYCLRFLLMILLLLEIMNQSLGTCPKFGVHFRACELQVDKVDQKACHLVSPGYVANDRRLPFISGL